MLHPALPFSIQSCWCAHSAITTAVTRRGQMDQNHRYGLKSSSFPVPLLIFYRLKQRRLHSLSRLESEPPPTDRWEVLAFELLLPFKLKPPPGPDCWHFQQQKNTRRARTASWREERGAADARGGRRAGVGCGMCIKAEMKPCAACTQGSNSTWWTTCDSAGRQQRVPQPPSCAGCISRRWMEMLGVPLYSGSCPLLLTPSSIIIQDSCAAACVYTHPSARRAAGPKAGNHKSLMSNNSES